MPVGSHGRIQIQCPSLAAGTCEETQVSARPREILLTKRNLVKLSSAARETESNNFPYFFPILVSSFFPNNFAELLIFFITQKLFVFPACVPCNLYLDFLGRIPKRVSVNRRGVALCRISPVIAYLEPEVWGPIQSCRPWPEVCLLLKSKKLDSE